ncbi:MAG TPA: RDD family protein [Ignavibacteriales bacterium]|nr:RDD family protein [Ignavibacteriales bacterium]
MHNCPQCNTPFEKGEKVCSNCRYNLEQEFICDPICPVCGTLYEAGTKRCKFDDALLIGYKDFTVKCVRCGAVYPPETKLCPVDGSSVRPKVGEYKSGSDSNYNKYGQYSKIEGYVYPKASLGPRYISLNIDGLIALLFFLSIFLGVYIIGSTYYNEDNENVLLLALGILQWTMPLIYFFIKDGFGSGQSIGKKSCRVMVVDLKTKQALL